MGWFQPSGPVQRGKARAPAGQSQVDHSIASLDALPGVVDAVGDRTADGGMETRSHRGGRHGLVIDHA